MRFRLQEFREAAGLSKKELAERAGVTERTLFSIERGTHQPNVATASKIADALGIPFADLFAESPEAE
jgi:putative transcriptional regulator